MNQVPKSLEQRLLEREVTIEQLQRELAELREAQERLSAIYERRGAMLAQMRGLLDSTS